jgi:hypothetical protein
MTENKYYSTTVEEILSNGFKCDNVFIKIKSPQLSNGNLWYSCFDSCIPLKTRKIKVVYNSGYDLDFKTDGDSLELVLTKLLTENSTTTSTETILVPIFVQFVYVKLVE